MEFQKCARCGTEFLFRRSRCAQCRSEEFHPVEHARCTVVDSLHLIATPDPFPDQYSLILFRTENGGKGFCRTDEVLEAGMEVDLSRDEFGPVCFRKG